VRARLAADEMAAAWAAGRALPLEAAIADALGVAEHVQAGAQVVLPFAGIT
jgi:hypothetical protein